MTDDKWTEATSYDQLRDPATRIRVNRQDAGKTVGYYADLTSGGTPLLAVLLALGFLIEIQESSSEVDN